MLCNRKGWENFQCIKWKFRWRIFALSTNCPTKLVVWTFLGQSIVPKYLPRLVNVVKEWSQRNREKKNLRLFFLLLLFFSEMRQFQIRTGLEHHEHTVCVWKAFTISGALFFLFTRTGCSVHWTSENLRKALLLSRN